MFNFGLNWQEYSRKALDNNRFNQAVKDLDELVDKKNIQKKSFLDIGCGSGIHSLAASKLGASKVTAVDISAESIQASKENKRKLLPQATIDFQQGSIFDMKPGKWARFDVVYSWGVLHHTGDMNRAVKLASKLVAAEGLLVLALYNHHWSSPLWWQIKRVYNLSPVVIKKLMVWNFAFIIALAKFVVTGKNPFQKKRRGMTFYYDVIDWLGGFPYEYASKQEVVSSVEAHGFKLVQFVPSTVPTGCHEYVFRKQ